MRKSKIDAKNRRCKLCGKVFVGKKALIDHIDRVHKSSIPDGWSASRYENFLRTGKTEGKCVCCGEPTEWNESTWKYHRICKKKSCRDKISKNAKKNMVGKYGKEHLLDDPEMQRKMVYAKHTSKTYYYEDPEDPSIKYAAHSDSSYGYDFFEMTDIFLNFNGRDVIAPSPNVYYYTYNGEKHFYIPDAYIISLNLEVECKDGGSNPNNHPKIQAVDKEKERLKDEVMYSLRDKVNYIKIVNKDYTEFFTLLSKLKSEDIVYMPKWFPKESNNSKPVQEEMYEGDDFDDIVNDMIPDEINDILPKQLKIKKVQKSTKVIHTYCDIVNDLSKDIDNIKTPQDYRRVEATVLNLRDYLSSRSNSNDQESKRLKYEADKAIKKIDMELLPKLETKACRLRVNKTKEAKAIVSESNVINTNPTPEELLDSTKYQPVYVFLTYTGTMMAKLVEWWTHDRWTHSSFSLDETMTDMFSFTAIGLTNENIYTGDFKVQAHRSRYSVWAMMVPAEIKKDIETMLRIMYSQRERFRYSIKGVLSFVTGWSGYNGDNAKFCSQFVAEIINMIDYKILGRSADNIRPQSFTETGHLVHLTHGKLLQYDAKKTMDTLIAKIKKGEFTDDKISSR